MTRVNVGIPPKDLSQKHLMSEHREIKRIPNAVREGKINLVALPQHFTLGTGHVRFFYNKLGYLLQRYKEVRDECWARGYMVQNYESAWEGIPKHLMGDWEPREEDVKLIKQRIDERTRATSGTSEQGGSP